MRNHKVAIQGGLASFHNIAARRYFGEDITVDECGTFREVCEKIAGNTVDFFDRIECCSRLCQQIQLQWQIQFADDVQIQ